MTRQSQMQHYQEQIAHECARERMQDPHTEQDVDNMLADCRKSTTLDSKTIALDEPREVRSWTERLKCSHADLHIAVGAVGRNPDKVREYLATRSWR